jgi:O-antigen ligase
VISCGILSFLALFVTHMSVAQGSYVARLDNMYSYDSNDLGVVITVGLPLTLLLLGNARRFQRVVLLLILVGIAATMARSGSRGGFLGFAAVGVSALVLVKTVSAARKAAFLLVTLLALSVGAPPGYWKQMGTLISPKDDYNYSSRDGRKALVQRGIGYMTEYPVFGLGINNFSRAECTVSPKMESLRRNGPVRCTPPHNSFVEAGAELGLAGLVAWVSLVLGGVVAPLRLRRRLPQSWRRGTPSEQFIYAATSFFPLAMIGFAITSFFVSFAWMDPVYLMAALLTGLYVSARAQARLSAGAMSVTSAQNPVTYYVPTRRGTGRWRGPVPLPPGAR